MAESDLFAPPTEQEVLTAPPTKGELDTAMFAPPSEREVLNTQLSGRHSDKLDKGLQGTQAVSIGQAANTMAAADEFYSKEHGWLESAFYALSIPEQAIARQTVNLLESAGAMTTDEAREILARDQVHGSDIVNFYWRDPNTWYGKTGRFVTGLAADILIDPLSYVGVGALSKAAKAATVAGKNISGLGKVSKAERAYYKTLGAVEKILKADGSIVSAADDIADVMKRNDTAIAKARDQVMQEGKTDLLGMADLLEIGPNQKEQILKEISTGMTEKSWAQEWKEGSRGLTFGARIPFTDMAFEVDMPGHLSKLVSLPVVALDGAYDFGKSLIRQTGFGDAAYNLVSDLGTRTGKFIFDVQQNTRLGNKNILRESLGEFETSARALLIQKKKNLGDEKFMQYLADVTDEMEMGLKSEDEMLDLAEKFKVGVGTDVDPGHGLMESVVTGTAADHARMARLAEHPETLDLIEDMRQLMRDGAESYKSRGLPFEELNPFGEGWARNYLKHDVSEEFLRKFREVNDSSDVIGEAMKTVPELMGKVDPSALGRKYRGTIREANAASLEKYGVKMFVDDPIELISKRVQEMEKVVSDHDLMEAALPYAVKNANPGQGFVKFNPDHFKRLSIDQSDEFASKWDAFIPEGFKTSDSVYLPEDVYDRMLFNINGWNTSKPMQKMLNAADFYTNAWRNNALFGASYIGLNAFSNALTYLSFNDVGGAKALAKATAILTPMGKNITVHHPELGALTGDMIFKMAIEDNLMNSSFSRGLEFSKMAEHVASNREARKSMGQKAMDIADTAFLWRYSRGAAQYADEIPKLATYISRLETGFSRKGAAEMAERYWYNFNNMSRVQAGVAKAIPFSSFPMKTAEMVYEQARSGHLAQLAIPGKVQAALDGAFVQDYETRDALDQMLPGYKRVLHPIHGELMPGMRELQVDIPWTYSTMQTLFNPEDSQHPIFNILGLIGAAKAKTEQLIGVQNEQDAESVAEAAYQNKKVMYETLDLAIPPWMREAMTMAEVGGAANFGGYFKDRYLQTMPNSAQIERGMSDRATLDNSTVYHKFTNAVEFGEAMDKKYGEHWLYNMVFSNRPDEPETMLDQQEQGARGEYIRRRMRQMTLGLASITKLDSNFLMNTFAIKRQIDIKEKALRSEIQRSGLLMDTERISEPEYLERLTESHPAAKELMALNYKRDALTEYYEFFLGAEKKIPDLDLPAILFGTQEFQFDYGDKPDKEVYEQLFKRQTIRNIPNEDAADVIEAISDEESQ